VNTSDCISSIQYLIQFFVIVKSSLIQLWLSIGSLFQLWLSKGSLLELSLSREVSFLCDWATCNLTLHFSGTLLGSARGTGLLPVYGRNLYNCLCSLFLCSITFLSAAQDSELTQTLNLGTVLERERNEVFETHNSTPPPFLWFFSPSLLSLFSPLCSSSPLWVASLELALKTIFGSFGSTSPLTSALPSSSSFSASASAAYGASPPHFQWPDPRSSNRRVKILWGHYRIRCISRMHLGIIVRLMKGCHPVVMGIVLVPGVCEALVKLRDKCREVKFLRGWGFRLRWLSTWGFGLVMSPFFFLSCLSLPNGLWICHL